MPLTLEQKRCLELNVIFNLDFCNFAYQGISRLRSIIHFINNPKIKLSTCCVKRTPKTELIRLKITEVLFKKERMQTDI